MQQQPMEWVACLLLVDPVDGGRLPADELLGLEPGRDLLLRGVDLTHSNLKAFVYTLRLQNQMR